MLSYVEYWLRSARRLDDKSYGRGGIFLNKERGLEIPRGKPAVGGASPGCRRAEGRGYGAGQAEEHKARHLDCEFMRDFVGM